MNVLIFKVGAVFPNVYDDIKKKKNITIHCAITEKDLFSIAASINPELTIIGKSSSNNIELIPKFMDTFPDLKLIQLGKDVFSKGILSSV